MTQKTRDNDVAFIKALAELLHENDLTELEVKREYGEDDRLNVRVSRGAAATVAQMVAPRRPRPRPPPPRPPRPPPPAAAARRRPGRASRRRHLADGRHGLSAVRTRLAAPSSRSATACPRATRC